MVPIVEGAGGIATDWRGAALDLVSDGRILVAGDRRSTSGGARSHRRIELSARRKVMRRAICNPRRALLLSLGAGRRRRRGHDAGNVVVRRPQIRARLQEFRLRQPERAEGRHDAPLRRSAPSTRSTRLSSKGVPAAGIGQIFDTLDGGLRGRARQRIRPRRRKRSSSPPTSSRCSTRCARRRAFTTARR